MNFSDRSELLSHYGSFYLYGLLSTVILSLVGTFGGLFLGVFLAFGKRGRPKEPLGIRRSILIRFNLSARSIP